MDAWELILGHLLGWSKEDVAQWAARWEDGLSGESVAFSHESPTYYATQPIIEQSGLPRRVQLFGPFISQVHHAIGDPPFPADYDWGAVKRRVDAVLDQARVVSRP
jgi:hypothetical protein